MKINATVLLWHFLTDRGCTFQLHVAQWSSYRPQALMAEVTFTRAKMFLLCRQIAVSAAAKQNLINFELNTRKFDLVFCAPIPRTNPKC